MFGQGFGGCVGAHSGTLGKALTGSSVSPSGSHPLPPKPPRPDDSRKPLVCFHNALSRQILQGPVCLFWSLSRKAKSKENAQVWGQRLSLDISCMISAMCQELVQPGSKRCLGKTRPRILIRAMSHTLPSNGYYSYSPVPSPSWTLAIQTEDYISQPPFAATCGHMTMFCPVRDKGKGFRTTSKSLPCFAPNPVTTTWNTVATGSHS